MLWSPGNGHPARVEDVGHEAALVGSRREGGAETPLPGGEDSICTGVLQGHQAGGGGKAYGV